MITQFIKVSILCSFLFISGNFANEKHVEINCCSSKGGKCVGSANCTACSNCSRCAYCSSGGSCGVCAGRRTTSPNNYNNYSTPRSNNNSNTNNASTNESKKANSLKLVVISQELKLRLGPGTEYEVIANYTLGDQLTYLSKEESWIYVTDKNGKIGYVYYKFVKFLD